MNRLTSGVRMSTFWIGFSGPNQTRSPIRLAPLSPTRKPQHLVRQVGVADQLDLARVADAEPGLVRQADVRDGQRIEAHQLRRDRVDRHLIAARQHDVLDLRDTSSAGPARCPPSCRPSPRRCPLWISFWIASRSTSVSWIQLCV